MATTFKPLARNDVISTKTMLHENIPLTGTIISGTYSDNNIKNYSHGMFQSVFDYPYLSSSANHVFDISMGFSTASPHSASATQQPTKKNNIYNQMAQILSGYDKSGEIQSFDADGNIIAVGEKINDAMFITFARLLVKDEIKKGSFTLTLGTAETEADPSASNKRTTIQDIEGDDTYYVNSPAGEYGILWAEKAGSNNIQTTVPAKFCKTINGTDYVRAGLIYYQAGVAVITSSVLINSSSAGGYLATGADVDFASAAEFRTAEQTKTIAEMSDALRTRIVNMSFNNTTELNSTIYFCRINHNEYNYSSNPTYLSASQIRVKTNSTDTPISYISTVGLYSPDNQLLAVGKLSEVLRKDPTIEYTLRARLDF